jgi:hypothetical protein
MRVIQSLITDALVHIQIERLSGRLDFCVRFSSGWRGFGAVFGSQGERAAEQDGGTVRTKSLGHGEQAPKSEVATVAGILRHRYPLALRRFNATIAAAFGQSLVATGWGVSSSVPTVGCQKLSEAFLQRHYWTICDRVFVIE